MWHWDLMMTKYLGYNNFSAGRWRKDAGTKEVKKQCLGGPSM